MRSIQRAVTNCKLHRRRIQRQRRTIFWLLPIMVGSAVSVWLNTQYHGIDDSPIQWEMHSTEVSNRRRLVEQVIKLNINSCGNLFCVCGIEYNFVRFDSSTEKAYQINDGLGDTLQDKRSLQRAVLNRRRHRKRIQRKIKRRTILWIGLFGWQCVVGYSISILWDRWYSNNNNKNKNVSN